MRAKVQKPFIASLRVILRGVYWLSVFFLGDLFEHELHELKGLQKT